MRISRSNVSTIRRANQQGFTLMEIIIVVILIGSIAAFSLTKIMGSSDRAKYKLTTAKVMTVAEKVQDFERDTGRLPNSLDELVSAPGNASGWLGPYMKASDLKDDWGHAYEYRIPGDGGTPFSLMSLGKDGQVGGDSVNADIKYEQ